MFTKDLGSVSFADVDAFVQAQEAESVILDYKQDWPSDLAKIVAAMANTQGGLVLLGIAEERDQAGQKTGRPGDIVGVDNSSGQDILRQKVLSICYRSIYPPIIPEIGAVQLDSNPSRAVVLIRVSPSMQTPHAVDSRRRIYVRVDSITQPHSLAELGQLEWLWSRREKAIRASDAIAKEARERADYVLRRLTTTEFHVVQQSVVPRFYSGQEVLTRADLRRILHELRYPKNCMTSVMDDWRHQFPPTAEHYRSVENGYAVYSARKGEAYVDAHYLEAGSSGNIHTARAYYRRSESWLSFFHVLAEIDGMLQFAMRVYSQHQPVGPICLNSAVERVEGLSLVGLKDLHYDGKPAYSVASELPDSDRWFATADRVQLLDEVIEAVEIDQMRYELVREAGRRLAWAFGHSSEDDVFDTWYAGKVRPMS